MAGGLSEAVEELVDCDITLMSDAAIRVELFEIRTQVDRLEHRASALLVAAHHRGLPDADGAASTPTWMQWRTGQRWLEAKQSLDAGVTCESLPLVDKAWAHGEISASAARTICEGLVEGHEDVYVALQPKLVEHAGLRQWRDLRALISEYHGYVDAVDDREPADRNGFYLSHTTDRWIASGDFDDLGGCTLDEAIRAATGKPDDGDDRTPAKRRADAIITIARYFLDHEDLPVEAGEAPHISIGIDWQTIVDARDQLPCRLVPNWLGPHVSPAQLGQLLCEATITTVILGPDHRPLDVGREMRTPPRWMRRALDRRDKGCRYPGCERRVRWCEAHHVWAWEAGGPTNLDNLVLLCPHHHHVVHRKDWNATFDCFTFRVFNPQGELVGST